MTPQQQTTHIYEFLAKQKSILLSKGDDYANEDRLSNFKEVANLVGITPEQVSLVFLATKLTRLTNLLKKAKKPNHESIQDTILDMANYCILLDEILNEN